ncbi:hypothetical protein [Olleya marilimosa]|uniref:hypothetical protein n=1 Tax=Olleya marilimosa TaxID=272164 RepID=UPI00168CE9CB|nr:hypothetical protein [Olleya marilimosa]
MQKLNWKIIVAESIGIIFLIHGSKRFHISYYSDIWKALIDVDSEKLESLKIKNVGQFLYDSQIFGFWIFLVWVLLILLFKWKIKLPLADTILTLILVFLLFPIGFFNIDFITGLFNSIGALFTNDIGFSFLISGLILTLIGLGLLWVGIKINKNYTQHSI